ncbi:MAG: von Willebrand factor type A domain-containing protein [Raineya sp.]|jgi:Ca-activated chloride channel family protein|nr:von Willebrand factor type A domain-containing protein [Raineya sp.]
MKKHVLIWLSAILSIAIVSWKKPDATVTGKVTLPNGLPLANVLVSSQKSGKQTTTDVKGSYSIEAQVGDVLSFSLAGYQTKQATVGKTLVVNVELKYMKETVKIAKEDRLEKKIKGEPNKMYMGARKDVPIMQRNHYPSDPIEHNTEEYDAVRESRFLGVNQNPLSTFSIDVDRASYSNMRRFINGGQLPPKDVIRVEELINYFSYDYADPKDDNPFAVYTEISQCPWNKEHQLVQIGLQGKNIPTDKLPPSNLVFLIDVSGSMSSANKLPLVKSAMRLLVNQLRQQDKVSIVVYAGAAGLVLPATNNKEQILQALERLEAGGSTAGGAGIQLAYKVAEENFAKNGNNRVIIATDGDFNVGASSNAEMERLIEDKRKSGVFLTVLGFGMGNYKDSKMEILADKGNGNYAYIDGILEAEKVFIKEFGGTLFTIAKDVKIQVEFNPTKVKAYRLIGYENRALKNEDFNDDKKDAGEMGAGHTVTALYEVIPASSNEVVAGIDNLKYQNTQVNTTAYKSNEVMNVKLRYKQPSGDVSKLIEKPVVDKSISFEKSSQNFRWAASVAAFGMVMRDSEFKGNATLDQALQIAESAKGEDKEGYRAEFIRIIRSAQLLGKK